MSTIDKYMALVTSQHADKPKYMALVKLLCGALADSFDFASSLSAHFDLDTAAGVQLDQVGEWIGITRKVAIPISGVYFSFDTEGLGFDQGYFQGRFDPDEGIVSLDDDSYRQILKIQIAANRWDGTNEGFKLITSLSGIPDMFLIDNQDMSMTVYVSSQPSVIFLALIRGGFFSMKPAGVEANYIKSSVLDSPAFGFDVENQYISGFDVGAFAVPI